MTAAQLLEDPNAPAANSGGFSDDFSPGNGGPDLTPDPAPGKTRTTRKATKSTPPKRAAGGTARADVVADLADELEMLAGLIAMTWAVRDPICAPVLHSQAREIAVSTAALIARSERLLSMMQGSGLLVDVGRLVIAVTPLVAAVRAHHTGPKEVTPDAPDPLAEYAAYIPPGATLPT